MESRDLTATKVWFSCADKTADLAAEATDFPRVLTIINGRKQLQQNIRTRSENEKDEKTKQQLEQILRGKTGLDENELENWQVPGVLFGDQN